MFHKKEVRPVESLHLHCMQCHSRHAQAPPRFFWAHGECFAYDTEVEIPCRHLSHKSLSGKTRLLNSPKTKTINGIMLVVFPFPFVQVSL